MSKAGQIYFSCSFPGLESGLAAGEVDSFRIERVKFHNSRSVFPYTAAVSAISPFSGQQNNTVALSTLQLNIQPIHRHIFQLVKLTAGLLAERLEPLYSHQRGPEISLT